MSVLFTGAISCKAVLEQDKRTCLGLYVNQNKRSKDFAYIIAIAKQKGVPVHLMKQPAFQEAYPSSGGIVLEALARDFPSLSGVAAPSGLSAYVSGIEDPYNLGSTCRSLYAAGASLLVLPRRDWSSAAATLQKASAGAWEKMDIAMIDQDEELKDWAKQAQLPLVCSARDHAVSLFAYTWPDRCMLVIGGALRGISTTLLQGTTHVYIPYGRDFKNALDTPSAAAVMAFSWTRQMELEDRLTGDQQE